MHTYTWFGAKLFIIMETILTMQGITKSYFGIKVLDDVDFDLKAGEVHSLVGENGAGKSTLMKILSGVIEKDNGVISLKGQETIFNNPHEAQGSGISIVHQEGSLISYLTATQNIWLGREVVRKFSRIINNRELHKKTEQIMNRIAPEIPLDLPVKHLSAAHKQLIEIAKAISLEANIIIMDEPTSSLTDRETEKLFEIIRRLTHEDKAIIYVSHRMKEIFAISDRITVLKDGKKAGTLSREEATYNNLIQMMIGRDLTNLFARSDKPLGPVMLGVEGLSGTGFTDISFEVRKGEVVGIAGLVGSGRTELVRAIFGADRVTHGRIYLEGKRVDISTPKDGVNACIGLVPEDRKEQGLVLDMSIKDNMAIGSLKSMSKMGFVNSRRQDRACSELVSKLNIKLADMNAKVKSLSGGNQQKVVVAKWLMQQPKVLILDEPTRGIDVGAKAEMYSIIDQLACQGLAVLIISSEQQELLGICDKILVLKQGRLSGELSNKEFSEERIMHLMISEEKVNEERRRCP